MKFSERLNFGRQLKSKAVKAKGKFISERVGDLIENNDSVRLATTGFIESYVDMYLDHNQLEAQLEDLPIDQKTKVRLVECVSLLAVNTISGVIGLMSEAAEDPENVKQLPMLLSSQLLTEDLVKSFMTLDQREGIIEKAVEERIGKSGLISEHGLLGKAMDLIRSDFRAQGPVKQYVDDAVSTVAMPMIRETVFPAMQQGLKPLVDDWRTWLTGR